MRHLFTKPLLRPVDLLSELPAPMASFELVQHTRSQIISLLNGKDDRLLVIIGPCSVSDLSAAMQYADNLLVLKEKYQSELLIVMRAYFEKPRTILGWKGFLYDPGLDASDDIESGLYHTRNFLLQLTEKGMPVATEFINLITPYYYGDLVSWAAVGARTTQSQLHREFVSALPCPVGFKNTTDGNYHVAVEAVLAARSRHSYVSVSPTGCPAVVKSLGNQNCHLILRGGKKPNYSAAHIHNVAKALNAVNLSPKLMIDCSHANSAKDHLRQKVVVACIAEQLVAQQEAGAMIFGVMVESYLAAGKQELQPGRRLTYGQSVTDACIGWSDTVSVLEALSEAVRARRHRANTVSVAMQSKSVYL